MLFSNVAAPSQAAEKGLAAGDVIVEINQQAVATPDDVIARIGDARKNGRKTILMLMETKGNLRFIALSLDDKEADKKPADKKLNKDKRNIRVKMR